MLTELLNKSLQEIGDVADNNYLEHLRHSVERVERAANSEPTMDKYVRELAERLSTEHFALNGILVNEFTQKLGEVDFMVLCQEKGVKLTKVPEVKGKQTPDFELDIEGKTLFFEVKTPSVVNGDIGIKEALEDSLQAHIEIEKQIGAGKATAIGESTVRPYGDKPYTKKGVATAVVEVLIDKVRQNIKRDQFPNDSSFLVLNLCMIPPYRTENSILRPVHCDPYLYKKPLTGELWMLAFGQPGMLIHGIPEFEGKPAIEGIMTDTGILNDPQYDCIAGILPIVHPWNGPSGIWGLFKAKEMQRWCDDDSQVGSILLSLTGNNWNDEADSNAWSLQWGDTY